VKVRDYVECNVRLTWIINPKTRIVEIHRPGVAPQIIREASIVSTEPNSRGSNSI
jgi:Uma2 family endonuclease